MGLLLNVASARRRHLRFASFTGGNVKAPWVHPADAMKTGHIAYLVKVRPPLHVSPRAGKGTDDIDPCEPPPAADTDPVTGVIQIFSWTSFVWTCICTDA